MLTIKADRNNKDSIQFAGEMADRMEFVLKELPIETAEDVLVMVKDAIPSGVDYNPYREALDIFEVEESDPKLYVVGVLGMPKRVSLKVVDTIRTVLYIRPSSRSGKMSEAALILRRYEPWTVATMPFEPSPDDAEIVARRVSMREVNLLEVGLRKVLPTVERKLKAIGVKTRTAPQLLGRKVLLDLSFFALRLEFGFDGFPYKPHWRPALRKVASRGYSRTVTGAMLEPKFRGWRRKPRVMKKVPARVVQVEDFQERTAV